MIASRSCESDRQDDPGNVDNRLLILNTSEDDQGSASQSEGEPRQRGQPYEARPQHIVLFVHTKQCRLDSLPVPRNVGHAFVVPIVASCIDLVVHLTRTSMAGAS